MKKVLYLVGILMIVSCVFAGELFASNLFRTSIAPYSWQRISSSAVDQETENSDYGVGIKLGYLHTMDSGLSLGAEAGMFDYYLSDEENTPNDNGNCVVYPMFFRFGYYTPKHKESKIKYFILADIGARLLHVRYEKNINFSFGAEVGVNFALSKGFSVGIAIEPEIAFSNKKRTATTENYTDFIVSGNIGLIYEW